jgi:hypothetical protein
LRTPLASPTQIGGERSIQGPKDSLANPRSFGQRKRVRNLDTLRENFHQAVVEVYTLKATGQNLDLSALPNRGIYEAPTWVHEVKLQKQGDGQFALKFPKDQNADTLLEAMQSVPEWDNGQAILGENELDVEVEDELEVEAEAETPVMDPNTPPAKRAALVTQDQKPFDFMSNRPVPRSPVAPKVAKTDIVEESTKPAATTPSSSDITKAAEASLSTVGKLRYEVLQSAANSSESNVAALRDAVRASIGSVASESITRVAVPTDEVKWRQVPLSDLDIKFAVRYFTAAHLKPLLIIAPAH